MRKMYTLLVIFSILLLCGCGAPKEPSHVVVTLERGVDMPSGVWYFSGKEAWDKGYLPPSLSAVFFGESAPDYSWVLFLGTEDDVLAEFLYAVCHTQYEAQALAETLSLRLAFLKKNTTEAYTVSLNEASVLRRGQCVIYSVMPQNDSLLALLE